MKKSANRNRSISPAAVRLLEGLSVDLQITMLQIARLAVPVAKRPRSSDIFVTPEQRAARRAYLADTRKRFPRRASNGAA